MILAFLRKEIIKFLTINSNTTAIIMKQIPITFLILVTIITSCKEEQEVGISTTVQIHMDELLNTMEANSINRNTIVWTDFRSQVMTKVESAQTIELTYDAIKEALILLGDNHSSYKKESGSSIYSGINLGCNFNSQPAVTTIPSDIGYVKVKAFSGTRGEAIVFARGIENQIKETDGEALKSWIVDLRGNTGGNMWPMISGIGSILGEGTAGYFIDPDG